MLYPLLFHPIFKERVWGGRELERLYHKTLPPDRPVGESWEISDRPGDASVIANGPLAGRDLRWLMQEHHAGLLGEAKPAADGRFPLLCKILDARAQLSLQVHPPAARAAELGGEPKTELWFVAHAAPGAELYVGLKRGVTRAAFEEKLRGGDVADCIHRVRARTGDAMFLPSGRVHAIGAGLVIFEIQQNSDTTYRVFDWNRAGLDGRPRELHVAQSLASINFIDFEPGLVRGQFYGDEVAQKRPLVTDPLFTIKARKLNQSAIGLLKPRKLQVVVVVSGRLEIRSGETIVDLPAGGFCLVPAGLDRTRVSARPKAVWLHVEVN